MMHESHIHTQVNPEYCWFVLNCPAALNCIQKVEQLRQSTCCPTLAADKLHTPPSSLCLIFEASNSTVLCAGMDTC